METPTLPPHHNALPSFSQQNPWLTVIPFVRLSRTAPMSFASRTATLSDTARVWTRYHRFWLTRHGISRNRSLVLPHFLRYNTMYTIPTTTSCPLPGYSGGNCSFMPFLFAYLTKLHAYDSITNQGFHAGVGVCVVCRFFEIKAECSEYFQRKLSIDEMLLLPTLRIKLPASRLQASPYISARFKKSRGDTPLERTNVSRATPEKVSVQQPSARTGSPT